MLFWLLMALGVYATNMVIILQPGADLAIVGCNVLLLALQFYCHYRQFVSLARDE